MNSGLFRTLLIYGIVVPLAIVIGWMMSSPNDLQSMATIGAVLFVLLLPLILKFHYALLVFSWNATIIVFFLPGAPTLAALMVVVNLAMAVGYRILLRRPLFTHVPSLTFTLAALALVVLVTAQLRGGIGMRALGSGMYGGKQYFYLLIAILGYFAFASQSIDLAKIGRFTKTFYLSGLTGIISNLIYFHQGLWVLYLVFPVSMAISQAQADYMGLQITRIGGFFVAGTAVAHYLLARYGLRGVFAIAKPWRAVIFAIVVVVAALSGFRSSLLALFLIVAVLFILEGLLLTRWFFVSVAVGLLLFTAIIPVANKLPISLQRSLSMLPIEVDPVARYDALGSLEWRLLMWKAMVPDLPKYVWLGKGYGIDPTAMYLAIQAHRRGLATDYSSSVITGDYHNGPLSVYVPFGSPGVIALIAFWIAAIRVLWLNHRHGSQQTRLLNQFLLAMFITKCIMFITIFGSLHSDMAAFTGIVGISVALNRGVCRKKVQPQLSHTTSTTPLGLEPRPI